VPLSQRAETDSDRNVVLNRLVVLRRLSRDEDRGDVGSRGACRMVLPLSERTP
jgi:hypothetical protein